MKPDEEPAVATDAPSSPDARGKAAPVPTPDASAPPPANPTSEELERRKLELQIAELELKNRDVARPEYRRSTFWISVSAAVIAGVGVIAQGQMSMLRSERADIKEERAQLVVEKAKTSVKESEEGRKAAELEEKAAKVAEATALSRLKDAREAEERVWRRLSDARPKADEIEARLQQLETLSKVGGSNTEVAKKASELRHMMASLQKTLFRLRVKVEGATTGVARNHLRRVTISSSSELSDLTVYVFPHSEWQSLFDEYGIELLRNEELLRSKAKDAKIAPFDVPLSPGKYVFVSWGNNLIVPETVTIP